MAEIRNKQHRFLEFVARKLDIQKASDWTIVTKKDLKKLGGERMLKDHGNSMTKILQIAYPETNWENLFALIKKDFKIQENRRKFLDTFASKHHINNPKDWGKISAFKIAAEGGYSLVNIYKFSLIECLKASYSEVQWNEEWFKRIKKPKKPLVHKPLGYWSILENQKNFFEELKAKHGIQEPKDWKKISTNEFTKGGGTSILRYYGSSRWKALEKVYPGSISFIFLQLEINWRESFFVGKKYWLDVQNRKQFLEKLADKLEIKSPKDWGKVTLSTIVKNGGATILKKYGGNFRKALRDIFPSKNRFSMTYDKDVAWKQEWFPLSHSNKKKNNFVNEESNSKTLEEAVDWRIALSMIQKNVIIDLICS